MRTWILLVIMGICDRWSIGPLGLHFDPPGLYCDRPRLYFEPLKLISFDFNADPDPAFHSNADPDLCPASKYNADPDPQPFSVLYVGPHLEIYVGADPFTLKPVPENVKIGS